MYDIARAMTIDGRDYVELSFGTCLVALHNGVWLCRQETLEHDVIPLQMICTY